MITLRNFFYTLYLMAKEPDLMSKANSIKTAARLSLCDLADISFLSDEPKFVLDVLPRVIKYLKETHSDDDINMRFALSDQDLYCPPQPLSFDALMKCDWPLSNSVINRYNGNTRGWTLASSFGAHQLSSNRLSVDDTDSDSINLAEDSANLDKMFAICLEFVQSKSFLPEEQLRCRLWSPLLETAICNNSRHLFHGHEYKIDSHVDGYKKVHRCDIVEILRLDSHGNFHAPLLMVELSAVGKVTEDTYHKDYEKLASQMQASLFYYITVLGRNVDQCKKLKIYGLLINQLQYQLFVMTPIIECDDAQVQMKHVTFLVTSPRQWRRSLNLKFKTFESINDISFGMGKF
jgi:hypothetical protein